MYSEAYDAQIDAEINQMEAEGCWKIVAKEDYVNRKDVTGVIYAIQRL